MKIISFPARLPGSTFSLPAAAAWLLACGALNAAVNPAGARIPDRIFSIANCGAGGDGTTTNTPAIQAAAACRH